MLLLEPENEKAVLCIPEDMVDNILKMYHNVILGSHHSLEKAYLTIKEKSYIPNLMHHLYGFVHAFRHATSIQLPTPKRKFQQKINLNYMNMSYLSCDTKFLHHASMVKEVYSCHSR